MIHVDTSVDDRDIQIDRNTGSVGILVGFNAVDAGGGRLSVNMIDPFLLHRDYVWVVPQGFDLPRAERTCETVDGCPEYMPGSGAIILRYQGRRNAGFHRYDKLTRNYGAIGVRSEHRLRGHRP